MANCLVQLQLTSDEIRAMFSSSLSVSFLTSILRRIASGWNLGELSSGITFQRSESGVLLNNGFYKSHYPVKSICWFMTSRVRRWFYHWNTTLLMFFLSKLHSETTLWMFFATIPNCSKILLSVLLAITTMPILVFPIVLLDTQHMSSHKGNNSMVNLHALCRYYQWTWAWRIL